MNTCQVDPMGNGHPLRRHGSRVPRFYHSDGGLRVPRRLRRGARAQMSADPIVTTTPCPACRAREGEPCRTPIDGQITDWTHDARVYANLGVRSGSRE